MFHPSTSRASAVSSSSSITRRFSDSTNVIPSPGSDGKLLKPYDPLCVKLPVAIGIPMILIVFGIVLEILLVESNRRNGIAIQTSYAFGIISTQFIASMLPAIFMLPFAATYRELDWFVRRFQPFVVLQNGNAKPEESILLDYIKIGPISSLFTALRYRHFIVFWASLTALGTFAFQPLTSSILQIRQILRNDTASVTQLSSLGLSPNISNLQAFSSSAGYVDASVQLGLSDPPFVQGDWTVAQILFPSVDYLNGTLTVDTVGIQTAVNCTVPPQDPVLTSQSNTNWTLSSKSPDGCPLDINFDPTASPQQYGVEDLKCGGFAAMSQEYRPVMFWYLNTLANGTQQAKTVFCNPTIKAYKVQAVANMNNNLLNTVYSTLDISNDTDIGNVFNGVIFNTSSNPFIQNLAAATRSVVPGAVFKYALQLHDGPQSTFDQVSGFRDLTDLLYTRHLAVAAGYTYFVSQNTSLPASVVSFVPRLVVDALPTHILSVLLIITGIIGVIVQVIARKRRRQLHIASEPGSIASAIAMTAHSGFGQLLLPYDDDATLKKKLEGLRFRMDRRTGAILADEYPGDEGFAESDTKLRFLGKYGYQGITEGNHSTGSDTTTVVHVS